MGTRHYIGNATKQEYIECPYECRISYGDITVRPSCLPDLLIYALSNGWDRDHIQLYHDAGAPCPQGKCYDPDHIPWWCHEKQVWKNIAPTLINEIGHERLEHWKDRKKNECICKDDVLDNKVHEDAMQWFGERIEVKEKS